MNGTDNRKQEEIEIDLGRILDALRRKLWLAIAAAVCCGLLAMTGSYFFIAPSYSADIMFYVNNAQTQQEGVQITTSDISASRELVQSCLILLQSRETLQEVIAQGELAMEELELSRAVSGEVVDNAEFIRVEATGRDPQEALRIAAAIGEVLPRRAEQILGSVSVKVVDPAEAGEPSNLPGYGKHGLIAGVLGLLFTMAAIALAAVFDSTIRREEDLARCGDYPVLAAVPDMAEPGKGSSLWKREFHDAGADCVGQTLPFPAAEAYRLLRTKLLFSFADERNAHVIGISSALSGEGKSVTAVNLARSLSRLGKKVVLLDCDLRCPSLAEKLQLSEGPGLTDYLTGQCALQEIVRCCRTASGEKPMYVVCAGQLPPDPVRLLGSEKMAKLLAGFRDVSDYVILDLPPAGVVSDGLALAPQMDGLLLVVRRDLGNAAALKEVLDRFAFVGGRVLGLVYNGARRNPGKYPYAYDGCYPGEKKQKESS